MSVRRDMLGEILIRKKKITQAQLDEASRIQKETGQLLGAILLSQGFASEKDLLQALSEQLNIDFVSTSNVEVDWDLVNKLNKSLILEHRCFPIAKTDNLVTLAIANPLDMWAVSEAQKHFKGCMIKTVLVSQQDMDRLLEIYRGYIKSKIQRLIEE